MNNWVYVTSEPGLLTVGFYDPNGKWHPDSDFTDRKEASDRCAYLNGEMSHDVYEDFNLEVARQNQDLRSKIQELEMKDAYHDCVLSVFAKPIEVSTHEEDDRFEGNETPFCRIEMFSDPGDSSVGIWPRSYVALSIDQSDTWINRILGPLRVLGSEELTAVLNEAVSKKWHRVAKAREAMCDEFRAWCEKHGIRHEGDAQEMLDEVVVLKDKDLTVTKFGGASIIEAERWLRDFCLRWDEIGRTS